MADGDYERRGILFFNSKGTGKQPQYTGRLTLNGTEWEIAGWEHEGKQGAFISLKIQEPRPRREVGDGSAQRTEPRTDAGASTGKKW